MPYKNVSQPKQVAKLDGEVTGGSFHRKLGSVAMLGRAPVQVAVVAATGSPSKVFNLGLNDVSDIVLLSRDMAVVRDGSDLWGVVDLAHKARVDQVGQDAKLLIGPQNDTGVALKWDGSGEALTPGKADVSVRSFQLRGDHRAVDVNEAECFAVVDGGDGEFRIHPGPTPEQGSVTKVALPPGCKELDRVRGARYLSAVYSRNNSTLCVVRRAGNRLEPKMLRLDIPLTDVAVSETTLIALARDGRVVIYDSESIDKATSSMIEPIGEKHLGCQGEPRVVVVAGGTIFVGTSAGEVLMASLIRKQLMK
jgi:hypothetical protein